MAAHLTSGKINFGILRESYRRELLECLDKSSGSKAIVWDDALTGPVGLIAEYSLLKEHEVDKMFPLRGGRLPHSSVQHIIFIVRPKLELMDIVAENVHKEEQSGLAKKDFHIYFVPRKSLLCERRLKERGVYGTFTNVDEYCIDLVPLDSDLLSMEMESSFKDCFLDNDNTSLYHVAKGLMVMQALYGIIPNLYGKGQCARQVVDMMLRMRREMAGNESQITPQIDNLLIIDRNVDLLTPLLSQLTYEGLIDELFGINNTTVRLPADRFTSVDKQGDGVSESSETKKIVLNSGEELYADLRDKNFNAIGPTLSRRAKMLTTQFDERHAAKTVGEIKQFVSKLPHMTQAKAALAIHTSIAEMVKEVTSTDEFRDNLSIEQEFVHGLDTDKVNTYIEDCIAKQEPLVKVLRLVCTQSCANNGFKPKVLDYYKREIIQTYGFEHILTLQNLEKVGLLRLQTNRTFPTLKKSLKLVVDEVNEQNPADIAYVFSGYAPLSVRLAQVLHRPGWRSITELLNMLPGPTTDEIQQLPVALRRRRNSASSVNSATGDQKVTLVFFVGGVTFAEISALRFLSNIEDAPADYIIATTKIINGKTWLESISEQLQAQPVNPF